MGQRPGARTDVARNALQAKRDAIQNGRAFDETFGPELTALKQHVNDSFPAKRGDLEEMLDQGADILRFIGYGKKSIQTLDHDGEELQEDTSLDFEKQVYNHRYLDAMAKEIVRVAKSVHLTPELVRFEVRVLEAVIDWAEHNPHNFEWLDILKTELAERRAGKDTFELPKPAPKKRGPKPKAYHQMLAVAKPEPETTPASFAVPENYEF